MYPVNEILAQPCKSINCYYR